MLAQSVMPKSPQEQVEVGLFRKQSSVKQSTGKTSIRGGF